MADSQEQDKQTRRLAVSAWAEAFALRHRFIVSFLAHVVLFTVALLLAYLVWFDTGPVERQNWFAGYFLSCLPFFLIVKLLIFAKMKLFRGGWKHASIYDMVNILVAGWWFVLVAFSMLFLFHYAPGWTARWLDGIDRTELAQRFKDFSQNPVAAYFAKFSKGVLVLDFLASVFLVCAARLGFRLYYEEFRPVSSSSDGVRRMLMVGAGSAAETILREIDRQRVRRYLVIGLVDDDPGKRGMFLRGVPVLGDTGEIREICRKREVDEILIAIPSATRKQLRRVIELCSGTKLKFQLLPSVSDLIDGKFMVSQIRPVDINDLLGREAVQLDDQALARFLRGRRVLITGAGGSIGSEMCRQVANYQPAQIILVEQAETPLFDIENELRERHRRIPLVACVCDIYDAERVLHVWRRHRPEVVIHAAAHKHVPLMERDPCEAVKNNILGTKSVADASCLCGTDEFVMISTDKAVNPSSVMGASKRVAEIYTQARQGSDNCPTQFKAVRFGNVLDSAGSVVPTFRKQIADGGPVRVTHPDMRRYFMTIREAAQLVLQAAAIGAGGQIFLLDMGEPVRIIDLARQMITLSGFVPGDDIEIIFTGVRPGEKLFEELRTAGEDIEPTVHPKVMVWKSRPLDLDMVTEAIDEMDALANCNDRRRIISALRRIVPEYTPLNPPGAPPVADDSAGADAPTAPAGSRRASPETIQPADTAQTRPQT